MIYFYYMPRGNTHQVDIELVGKNKTKRAFADAEKGFKKLSGSIAVGAGALAGALGYSIKKAADFEQRLADISTLISGDSTQAIGELKKGILDMTRVIPRSADEIGAAAYDVLSAGIEGTSNQLKVLESAAKLGVAGLGTTTESVDILTSAINAFGLDAENSDQIANTLFSTVKFGKTNIAELSRSFGDAAASMVTAGVSLEEFSAGVAALTTTGTTASVAQNQMRAAVQSLITPNEKMKKALDKLGFASGKQLVETHDLVGAFRMLSDSVNGSEQAMGEMLGSNEAFAAVMPLITTLSGQFSNVLADMQSGVEVLDPAFLKASQTMKNKFALGLNAVNEIAIAVGDALSNNLGTSFDAVIAKMQEFAAEIRKPGSEMNELVTHWAKVAGVMVKSTGFIVYHVGRGLKLIGDDIASLILKFHNLVSAVTRAASKIGSFAGGAFRKVLKSGASSLMNMIPGGRAIKSFVKKIGPSFGAIGLAEGGIVTQPTNAIIGEAGPEAVVPLEKAGMMGGVTINISGNFVGSEEEAVRMGDIIIERAKLNKRFSY